MSGLNDLSDHVPLFPDQCSQLVGSQISWVAAVYRYMILATYVALGFWHGQCPLLFFSGGDYYLLLPIDYFVNTFCLRNLHRFDLYCLCLMCCIGFLFVRTWVL